MSPSNYLALEISLLQIDGEVPNRGDVKLVCDYRALHMAGTFLDGGRITVLAKDPITERWVEYRRETGRELAAEVAQLVQQLGIPERRPKVIGTIDTCESWTQLLLHFAVNQKTCTFTVEVQCSGFEGSDAETLQTLLQKLFLAAGYESHSRSVYGFD